MRLAFEDLDTHLFCHLLSILVDGNIETEDNGEFLRLFEHGRTTHDIFPVNGTNVDTRYLYKEKNRSASDSRIVLCRMKEEN